MPDDIAVYESILGIQTVGPVRLERDQDPSDTIIYVPDKGSDPLDPRGGRWEYVPDAGDPGEFRGPIIQPNPGSGSTRLPSGSSGGSGRGGVGRGGPNADPSEGYPRPRPCYDYPERLTLKDHMTTKLCGAGFREEFLKQLKFIFESDDWEKRLGGFSNPDSNLWSCIKNAICWMDFACKSYCTYSCDLLSYGTTFDSRNNEPPDVNGRWPPSRLGPGLPKLTDPPDMTVVFCMDVITRCHDVPSEWTPEMIQSVIIYALCIRCNCAKFEAYYFSSLNEFSWPQTLDPFNSDHWTLTAMDANLTRIGGDSNKNEQEVWIGKYIWWARPMIDGNGILHQGKVGALTTPPTLGGGSWPLNRNGLTPDFSSNIGITGGNIRGFLGAGPVKARPRR